MKERNAIFFSIIVIFYSWLTIGVLVNTAPLDDNDDANPDNSPALAPDAPPDVTADGGPDPDAGVVPKPDVDIGLPDDPDQTGPDASPDDVDEGGEEDDEDSDSELESESESESESEESDETKSVADAYKGKDEWKRRVIELNNAVYRLQGENAKLQHQVYAYENELKIIQELEASLSNEVETWLKGTRFPGLSLVHDPIGIESAEIINTVGEVVNDCNDAGQEKPGVYLLNVEGSPYTIRAFCVKGWTVVQRRFDGSEDFDRDFDDYLAGFGNFSGEFFLGLENLHRLTKDKAYTLRIDAKGSTGKWYYGVYEDFSLSDELDGYRISLGNMTAGNYLDGFENARSKQFSTRDRDNDDWRGGNCAEHYGGGWWSSTCSTNLNQMWCRSGCMRWAAKHVVSSIIRIKPSSDISEEDLSENPNPGGLTLDNTPA